MRRRKSSPIALAQSAPTVGISQFISDPNLLGRDFAGPSWINWRTTLKGAFGESMTKSERARFRKLAERDPPSKKVRECWFCIGRRGGKDSVASAIATYAATSGDFSRFLRRGERAVVLCLACDRSQAGIVFGYVSAFFEQIELLKPLVRKITADTVELVNGVDITVATNSYRSVRGRTLAVVIMDEVAYWRDESSSNPDHEVYAALIPGLATLRQAGAMLIGISTVYRRSGLLFDKWLKHHGKDDDTVLVIRQPSNVFNPTLNEPELAAEIQADLVADPERASAEWLSEWRSDLADFVDRAVVQSAVVAGRRELTYQRGNSYVAFTDPAGGSGGDSMTLAIGHRESNGKVVLDLLREVRPPFSPETTVAEFAGCVKGYGISRVTGDRYAAEWPREQFRKHGVIYEVSDLFKVGIYQAALPLLNSGRVELLDDPRLFSQIVQLERRTAWGGRDTIDHPRGGHDDVANAAFGALVLAADGVRSMEITRDFVQQVRSRLRGGSMPPITANVQSAGAPRVYQPPRAASFVPAGLEAVLERGGK